MGGQNPARTPSARALSICPHPRLVCGTAQTNGVAPFNLSAIATMPGGRAEASGVAYGQIR